MKKNLLQSEVKEELIARVSKLNPQSAKQWGKMNVNQMLRHLSEGLRIAYGDVKPSAKKTGWLGQKFMRFIILKTDVPAPKEKAKTFAEIDMVEKGINPPDFNAEKNQLVDLLKNFPAKQTYHESPMLGKMTTENWARLNYGHMDHHLRQFGV